MNWFTNLFRCRREVPQRTLLDAHMFAFVHEGAQYRSTDGKDYVYHNGKWLPL